MDHQPFRFLHAADLHIEAPVTGLTELPEHLSQQILDAPAAAAKNIFDAALSEKVDFLLLAGDILSATRTGPWGPLFLIEQFEKLRLEGIEVYWAGGRVDTPEDWPDPLALPTNVHRFPVGETLTIVHCRGGVPLARIYGTSFGTGVSVLEPDQPDEPDGLYTIGVFYGRPTSEALRSAVPQYWALGSSHRREFLSRSPSVAFNPGSPLARSPLEDNAGDSGAAALVDVNEFGRAEVKPIHVSPIRWVTELLTFADEPDEEALRTQMRNRSAALKKTGGDELTFVNWRFVGNAAMRTELRYGRLASSLLRDLRSEFGRERPILWPLSLEPVLPDELDAELYDQQTILGDYLRMTAYYQEHTEEPIELSDFFPEELREYLTVQYALEKERLKLPSEENLRVDSPPDDAVPVKTFRPETPELIRRLTLSMDERRNFRGASDTEKSEPRYREALEQIASARLAALREAAVFGAELLAGDTQEVRAAHSPAAKKNPLLAEERRAVQNYLDGKESLS